MVQLVIKKEVTLYTSQVFLVSDGRIILASAVVDLTGTSALLFSFQSPYARSYDLTAFFWITRMRPFSFERQS